MTDPLSARLLATLDGRRLLDHPFYQRWSMGRVTRDELRAYAAQYRHFERAMPLWLAAMAGGATDPRLRAQAEQNLADETRGPQSHLELFEQFAAALGAAEETPSRAMGELCATYARAATRAGHGFAALWAYEAQSAQVSRTKSEGLRAHYGLDGRACSFWDAHAQVEDEHARWAAEAVTASGDATTLDTARAAADAWWAFLDEREQLAA